jgi:hypothetical protein
MKTFFLVFLVSIFNIAQVRSTYITPIYSVQNELDKSITKHLLASQFQNIYLTYAVNNSLGKNNAERQRMDSLISNSITGGKLKMEFEYDNNDNIIEQLLLGSGVGSGWVLSGKTEYYFDNNQKLILELHLDWNGSSWDSVSRFEYFYNTQEQLNQFVYQNYTANKWENYLRYSYTYDVYENRVNSLTEEWLNGWQNLHLFTAYFSSGVRMDSSLFQMWNSTYWENYARATFYYSNQTQFLESFIGQLWTGVSWINDLNRKITNDQNGNQLLQLDLVWNGNDWENSIRRFFTYDDLNYTLTAYCELWNGIQWYPEDGDILIENPDGFSAGFLMHDVYIYYKTAGVDDEVISMPDNYILCQNYPNPFNSTTTIKYTIPYSSKVTLKVFDLLGNQIAKLVDDYQDSGSYEINFQANVLSSGIYFYQLQTDNYIAAKKLILLK